MATDYNPEGIAAIAGTGRPIPGQSLTNDPNQSYPWEGPPEFVKVNEAIEYIFKSLIGDSQRLTSLLEVLDSKTLPIAGMAQILLESGFRQGKWNPDLMLLLIEPTAYMIMGLAERAEIEYEVQEDDEEEVFGASVQRPEFKEPSELSEETQDVMERVESVELPEMPEQSLMARPPPPSPQPSLMQRQA